MFSTTKVMTLLLTSLLIFLAIELMDMDRDVTAFRERFNAYKNGKSVSEIYDAGLPKYAYGTASIIDLLDQDQLDTLHYIHNYFSDRGMGLEDISGIMANIFKESSFRDSAKDGDGYHGYVQMSPDMQTAVMNAYGNLDRDTQLLFILDLITGNSKVKGYTNGFGYKYGLYKTGGDAAEAFRATFERNKAGRQQSRIDYGNLFYNYLSNLTAQTALQKQVGEQPMPIVEKPDAVVVRKTIPKTKTKARWTGAENVSPYLTGKPILKLKKEIKLPDIVELHKESLWKAPMLFKYGKLPEYGGGKGDGMRYLWDEYAKEWDRVTNDPMMRAFADLTVTPSGSRDDNRTNPVYHDPRLKYAGYVTQQMLEDEANAAKQRETSKYAPGLEQVSPEFDLLFLMSGLRFNPLTQLLHRTRALSKEIDKVVDEGLVGATKDMPVLKASDMYNPEHFRSTIKYNPKLIGVAAEEAVLKDELGYPMEDWLISDGLHAYPIEDSSNNAINLIHGVGSPIGDYNAAKLGIRQVQRAKNPIYTSFDLAPNPPEATYTGSSALTIIPREQLGLHSLEILNPNIFTQSTKNLPLLQPRSLDYSDETFVDRNGKVNMKNLVKTILQVYKDFGNASDLQNYKNIFNYNSNGERTNLFEHIRDVVKTAQNIPVPKGYTRQDLVLAALFHDVGKILDSSINHGKTSVDLMDMYAPNVPIHVRDAVHEHMSGKLDLANPLSKALHFADVARGLSYDDAAFNFPHLLYDRDVPKLNIPQISLRDELKFRINPWLVRLGYPGINLNSTYEQALQTLRDRILWHKTLERGVRDPIKLTSSDPEDIRNAENVVKAVMEKYGVDEQTARSDEYLQQRLEYAGTTVPKDPTGSGRSNLFHVSYDSDKIPHHKSTRYSRLIGADRNKQDGLYVSTSDKVKNNYVTSSDNRGGEGYAVAFPENEHREGETLSEYLLRNDWELYNTEKLDRAPLGKFALYEGPYRLLTGRSLIEDMKKDGVIKPVYKDDPSAVVYPGLKISINRFFNASYDDVMSTLNTTNDLLKELGVDFLITPTSSGGIVKPKLLSELKSDLSILKRLLENLKLFAPEYKPFAYNDPLRDIRMTSVKPDSDVENALSDPSYLEYASQTPPQESYNPEDYNGTFEARMNDSDPYIRDGKIKKSKNVANLDDSALNILESENLISKKQKEAIKKAFKYLTYKDKNAAFKYIDIKKIANKYLDKYLKKLKGKKVLARSVDWRASLPTYQLIIRYMRSKGVAPRYEIEGFNKHRVFAVSGPEKNKTINQPHTKEIYGYILGEKGERVVNTRENLGYEQSKVDVGSRDRGERTNNKMTRKTLRAIIPSIIALDLYNKLKSKNK